MAKDSPEPRAIQPPEMGRVVAVPQVGGHAVGFAQQTGHREAAALYKASGAMWEAFFGNATEAARRATAALKASRARLVEYSAALALAISRDPSAAQKLVDHLARSFPEDTCVQTSYLPVLRARLALNQSVNGSQSARAVQSLEVAARSWSPPAFIPSSSGDR